MAKNKGNSFRAALFEFLFYRICFFLPVCKVSLLRYFASRFSVIQLVKESQMNLFFAYADISPVSAVSKNRHSGDSGAIISVNFTSKSGVFNSYVFPVYFGRQFTSIFKRQAVSLFPLTSARKRFPLEQIINVNHFFFTANTATSYIIMPGNIWWLDNGPVAKFSPNSYVVFLHSPKLSTSVNR